MRLLYRLLLICALLFLWQLSSGVLVSEFLVSKPSTVALKFLDLITSGRLLTHGFITLVETLVGFGVGAATGIALGLLLGRSAALADLLNPLVVGFNCLPKVALAPLFILWFGIGMNMKIVLVATTVFFLVFLNSFTGARGVSEELVGIMRLMGAKKRHIMVKVVVPSALNWVFAGLRLSVPYALIGAVVGEMIASNRGLGYLLQDASNQLNAGATFAALCGILVLALLLQWIVVGLEKWLMPWQRYAGSSLQFSAV